MANVFPIGVWVLRDFPNFPRLQRMSAMAERFENPNPSGQVVQLRNEVQQRSQERGVPLVGESEDSHCLSLLQPYPGNTMHISLSMAMSMQFKHNAKTFLCLPSMFQVIPLTAPVGWALLPSRLRYPLGKRRIFFRTRETPRG